ncbi:hypothetical protein GDO86_015138 [Hymenochirus boettgeri]|uniref:Uncharacterized protein n=1 Tax=Hymenochirus boettgeri TaxID=247094 RepID=A0A8T2JXG7_9PIPI|nr:hypothetical protein GDO86_015138 [Hymenochirus boettgeri]
MAQEDAVILQAELDRLSAELQETIEEKVQAAQYGLAVLEENSELRQKNSEFESECEMLKLELKQMKEALAESQSNHKRTAADGESREEKLLKETASKEAKLSEKIDELHSELKQLKSFLTNTTSENDRLHLVIHNLKKEHEDMERERGQLREEIKQRKISEMRHMQDFTELEEENISLLKQVSVLKENQVELEGVKHELKRRIEEIEIINGQVEELIKLREISERQLEEALETLKSEREQKNELRRELSAFLNYDSIGNLPVAFEDHNEEEFDSGYNFGTSKTNGDFLMSTPRNSDIFHPDPKLASNLFTELNLPEIQKLQQQLLQVDREKSSMVDDLQELKRNLDSAKEELLIERGRNGALMEEIQALKKTLDDNRGTSHDADEYVKCQCGQEVTEVLGLRMELKEVQRQYQDCKENCQQEREEWEANKQELTEKLRLYLRCERNDQGLLSDLKEDLKTARRSYCDVQSKLNLAQDELMSFIEDLAHLYHHVCMRNNLTPNRVMLDYYKDGKGSKLHFHKREASEVFRKFLVSTDIEITEIQSPEHSPLSSPASSVGSDSIDCFREPLGLTHLIGIVKDQIKHLQGAIVMSWQNTSLESIASEMDKDKEVLVDEIMKLKSLLSTKREQIATLRTVLKANKQVHFVLIRAPSFILFIF